MRNAEPPFSPMSPLLLTSPVRDDRRSIVSSVDELVPATFQHR